MLIVLLTFKIRGEAAMVSQVDLSGYLLWFSAIPCLDLEVLNVSATHFSIFIRVSTCSVNQNL